MPWVFRSGHVYTNRQTMVMGVQLVLTAACSLTDSVLPARQLMLLVLLYDSTMTIV